MHDELLLNLMSHLMRPIGDGIPTFSAGKGAASGLQAELYRMAFSLECTAGPSVGITDMGADQIDSMWKASWGWLPQAKVALLGVPLDTGAGIRRGAAYGPRGVRQELYQLKEFRDLIKKRIVVDLGDLYVNPHLLHDSMLNGEQIGRCRDEMYPTAQPELRSTLPVSALSQLKTLIEALTATYPHLHLQMIGGDHSVAWPMTEVLAKRHPESLGIVQSDAHTDLLSSRLGVRYCFGTWSYHAKNLLKGEGRMVQVGIRQSGKDKTHWEKTGVKQYWASEINSRPEAEVVEDIVTHLKNVGVRKIYFTNDIDGTDEKEAPSTGTPAADGISSRFLLKLIQKLGKEFDIVAGDVVEVAPDLGPDAASTKRTCSVAAKYMLACIQSQLRSIC